MDIRQSVLLLAGEFPPFKGGIARVADHLATGLVDRGHEVTVFAPRMGQEGETAARRRRTAEDGLRTPDQGLGTAGGSLVVRRFPLSRLRSVRMLPTLPFVLGHYARHAPDVCLALRCTREGILANLNRRITGTPYITFAYGTEFLRYPPGSRRGRMVRRIIDESARTFCISEFTRRALAERGCSPDRLSVMCPGIDRLPTNLPGQEKARDRLNLHGGPVLLSVSRLVPHKGHDTVLRALPRLRSRWSGLQYVVVGKGVHEAALRQLAQAVGVAEAVRFVGYVPDGDLASYYAACDVFVMPSREEQGSVEGFGISFLEAAAHGRPAIGGRGTGAEDAIADGVTGILVDPYSAEAVTEGIAKLLGDEPLRKQMGVAARARVESDFSWERAVATVERVLMEAATVGRP